MTDRRAKASALFQAFDEARFGVEHTLNLRASMPTVDHALARAEPWLRARQAYGRHEVLVVTGRGNNSPGGVSTVREAISRLLARLRRLGVVETFGEHSPGSFVVVIAPMRALVEAPRRHRDPSAKGRPAPPSTLHGLAPATLALLRELSLRALDDLGVKHPDTFVNEEMVRQFSAISSTVPDGPDRERDLEKAIRAAINERD